MTSRRAYVTVTVALAAALALAQGSSTGMAGASPNGWSSWSSGSASSGCTAAGPGCPGVMTTSRTGHTATLLAGPACQAASPPSYCGEVLAAGGDTTGRSAELFNPATGQWATTGLLGTGRSGHTATLLNGPECSLTPVPSYCGKVLIAGGTVPVTGATASAELYDPASGTWSSTGSLVFPVAAHSATLLSGPACRTTLPPAWCGNVLLTANGSSQLYAPASGTWKLSGNMAVTRVDASLTALDGPACAGTAPPSWCGEVLAAGGWTGSGSQPPYSSAELYSPATGTWSLTGSLAVARFQHQGTLVTGPGCTQQPAPAWCGTVLVSGGYARNFGDPGTTEVYDPSAGTWSTTGSLNSSRHLHAAVSLPDGRILAAGGAADFNTPPADLASAELFNPGTGVWSATGSMLTARSGYPAVLLTDGTFLAVGPGTSVELYTPANPGVTVSPTAVTFGRALVGGASAPQSVTVTNTGTVPLTVSSVTFAGANPADFTVTSETCSAAPVAPSATCTVALAFTPTAPALRTAQLDVNDNGPGSPHTAALSGTGESALLAVTGGGGAPYSRQDAQPYASLGGQLLGAPAVVAVPAASGAVPSALYVGIGADHDVYVRDTTRAWQALTARPVYCIDSPGALVTGTPGNLTLTVACEGGDRALYEAQAQLTTAALPLVTSWTGLGGVLGAGPAVVSINGKVTFFVTGGDGVVYQRDATSAYFAMPYSCVGHPAVASQGSVVYFACDGNDGALWYAVNAGLGWPAATSAGGAVTGGPGIAAATNQAAVYVEGTGGAVYHIIVSTSGAAGPFVADGGAVQGGAGAAALVP